MRDQNRLQQKLELLWWVFTLILVVAVLAPIYLNKLIYPFYISNIVYIVTFVTVTRYVFLLKHTWLLKRKWLKIGIVVASVILIFVFLTSMIDFNNYLKEVGLLETVGFLHADKQFDMIRYIQKEVMFFGVGSVIALTVLPVKLLKSLRRPQRKNLDS